jgi:hypothetical protein
VILKTDYTLLLLALLFFGLSILLDEKYLLLPRYDVWEELMKLFGLIAWLDYFVVTCKQALRKSAAR